ncbi:MAG: hypothetical protein Q7J44_15155 [Pseudotabrizicola sp.]|uniref:hypothetical protein n=1 Tax=Pseudotabrizicola sp. TaxID=2939647 RepID=UPI0027259A88|nr:hypothetical protein [Pseudotabrizicola sp.]MDO9639874.1 hypothetical protein [Pseudotabrizicola sp.]
MLPKISLPPPTIAMRTAVMLLQTQAAAAKGTPDSQTVVVEESRAAKGLEKLLHYARTAQALATRTTPLPPGDVGGRSAITPASGLDTGQANALLVLGARHVVHLTPPQMSDATLPRVVATELVRHYQTDAEAKPARADHLLRV